MAGSTLLRRDLEVTDQETGPTRYVQIGQAGTPQAVFEQVRATFANALAQAHYEQPPEFVQEKLTTEDDPWKIVAPGIAMRSSEVTERFGHLNLNDLRARMSDEVFRVFVKHAGSIRGNREVDATLLTSDESE